MRIAICHDFFESIGGGETEMKMLAEGLSKYHDVTLYTGYFNHNLPFNIDVPIKELGIINKFGPLKRLELMWRFSRLNLDKYDAVISENYWSSFIRHKKHIHHCEAPIRQFYDLRGLWSIHLPIYKRIPFNIWVDLMIPFEQQAVKRCKLLVTNSEFTKTRIKEYYNRDSVVIYPPVDCNKYKYIENSDFWLYVGRLDYNKRIELMADVFNKAEENLIIVGSGPLKRKINDTKYVTKYGSLSDEQLSVLYSRCKAVVYLPFFEDFGQVPIEAMASGKPVLGVPEGGLLETIIPNKTGWLVYPRINELVDKIKSITSDDCKKMRKTCEKQARKFDIDNYISQWNKILKVI